MSPGIKTWGRVVGLLLLLSVIVGGVSIVSTKKGKTEELQTRSAAAVSLVDSIGFPVANPWEWDFGVRGLAYLQETDGGATFHPGIDVNFAQGDSWDDEGEPIYAMANGEVVYAENTGGAYGRLVMIRHTMPDGTQFCSVYAHLKSISVGVSSTPIPKNKVIGTLGNSGTDKPHLHWEVRTTCGSANSWPRGQSIDQIEQKYVNPYKFVNDYNFYVRQTDKVTLFENIFFRGNYEYYYPGFTNMQAFESGLNNKASSMAVPSGWAATLYEDPQGDGAQKTFIGSDLSFINDGYSSNNQSFSVNDTVSSIRIGGASCMNAASTLSVEAASIANDCNPDPDPNPGPSPDPVPPSNPQNPGGRLILYTEKDYRNPYYELETGGWDVENREYRSISIPSGWSFILEESNGHQSCFNQSLPNLTDHESWQFKIDGLYVFSYNICQSNGSNPPPEPLGDWFVRLWTNRNFDGSSLSVKFTGDDRYFWFPSLRLDSWNFNDDIESMELNEQRSIAVYEHDSLQGGGKCFYDNDSDLFNDQFNNGLTIANQMSSFRMFVGDTCTLAPLTPQDLWVHAADKTKVILTWPLSSPNADGFYVYRIDSNGHATRIAQLSDDQAKQNASALGLDWYIRSWTFTSVSCGESYTFAISAYSDQGESGRTRQVTANTPPCDCNDVTTNGVVLFEDALCRGARIVGSEPMRISLANFNDKSSSIYIPSGWSIEVFEHTDSSDGLATCMTESKWDLSYDKYWPADTIVNDTISNVRVFNVPNCGRQLPIVGCDAVNYEGVALFDYTHCLGEDRLYGQPGFYNLTDFDNVPSSIHIKPGWSVRVWQENSRQGDFVCFNESKWDLNYDPYWNWDANAEPHWDSSRKANNNISSIEVFYDTLCGGIPAPILTDPNEVETVTDLTDLTLRWKQNYMPGFWGELWGPNGFFKPSGYLGEPKWHVGQLPAGEYILKVRSENFQQLSDWAQLTFTVEASTPPANMAVSYTVDPNMINRITFTVQNCVSEWVHVIFGDGAETDTPCQNGKATVGHDYTYLGQPVSYTAVVGGVPVEVTIQETTLPPADCSTAFPPSGVNLFSDKDCHGSSRSFGSPGTYVLTDFNDVVSAIVPAKGWSVEVFEHSNTNDTAAFCVNRDMWNLSLDKYYVSDKNMNDNISMIRIYTGQHCGKTFPEYGGCDANINYNGVVLFDYIHCGGSEQKFDKTGRYELGYGAPFNDLASSAHVAPGWSIKVYEHSGWTGDSSCFANDMWDLSIDKYWGTNKIVGNTISSVEVFKNSTCTPDMPTPVKPNTPTNLQPSGGTFELDKMQTFSWQGSADSYTAEFTNGSTSYILTMTQQSLQFGPPKIGQYTWRVKAVKAGLESDWSSVAVFTVKKIEQPALTTPSAPSNLRQGVVTQTSGEIVWDDNSSNESGFIIKKWDGQAFVEIARVGVNVTTHTDNNLQCGSQYKYVVSAFNAIGESVPTSELVLATNNCDVNPPTETRIYLPLIKR